MDSNPPFKTHRLLDLDGVSHGFFGRRGGVSETRVGGNYASLNTGKGSDDSPDAVSQNRARVANAIGAKPSHLLSLHQYHSTDVVTVTQPFEQNPKADGQVTQVPNLALSALGADCGPILFADPKSGTIGACHAGWRGAVAGIADATLSAMEALGAQRENIFAVLGPCISQENYEVGPEFESDLINLDSNFSKYLKNRIGHSGESKAHFDLKAFILGRLQYAGLTQISALPDCTYGVPTEYFSYRYNTHQGLGDYGRNISVIMLTE